MLGGTRFRLLGRLSIESDGAPRVVALPGRRSELVFAYLAAEHQRDVSRAELAEALWPNGLPDTWAAALRSVISEVRRAISAAGLEGDGLLEHTGDGYRLRLPPGAVVDIDEARDALANARAKTADDPHSAAADADRVAALARMPFLPRHEGEWVEGLRRELEAIQVEALELSARSHLRSGDVRAAAAAAERLVEAEPYTDAAHRLRIEVLGAAGDRAGALRAYREIHETLEDLGVEPSDETQAALRRVVGTAAEERPPRTATAATPTPFASLSVLVVDDHDFQRRTALALLGRLGVGELTEASDGAEALQLLESSEAPDVIVCDIDMPGMDGVEFIRRIAERRLASAVVIASGLDRSVVAAAESVGEGYGLRILGAVEKPLTARGLSELLASYHRSPPGPVESAPMVDTELRAALEADLIGACLIPFVDLSLGAVSGATAVPTRADQPGAARITIAEHVDVGLAGQLTDLVLGLACEAMDELPVDAVVWIAIARGALTDVNYADRLLAIVRGHDADPRRVVCTVAESAVRRSSPAELDVLTRLRVKGFGVCLDGYGGGHASSDALSIIPLTAVALAPALVRGAAGDPARAAALEEVLGSARAAGLQAVACGCDTAGDYELLMQLGCGHAQGEFIAGPLRSEELAGWARDWHPQSIAPGTAEEPG
jgi:DNA-binding SARP family transcriptional activator/EAL domain-containing protein (putative c-di-GMP-specific phosphodiesterase class I)